MNETKIILQTYKNYSFNNIKELPEIPGIYLIVNLLNNKKYIGQAVDIKDRIYAHLYNAVNKEKYHLYYALNKYGIENFSIVILETFYNHYEDITKLLNNQEIYYIKKYKTNNPELGYNNTEGGEGHKGNSISEAQKEAISKVNGKKTYAYNFINNYYLEADSRYDLCKMINEKGYNIDVHNIYDAIRHDSYSKDFIFSNSKDELELKIKTFKKPSREKIYLYNYKEDYYSEALTFVEAEKFIKSKGYTIGTGHVSIAVSKNNAYIKDFLFGYTKEELNEKIKNFEPYIYVYCIADGFFMQFKTNTEAVRILNTMGYKISNSSANKAVRGLQKHAGGFLFAKSMNKLMDKIYNFNVENAELIYKTAEENNLLNNQNLIQWQDKINLVSVK